MEMLLELLSPAQDQAPSAFQNLRGMLERWLASGDDRVVRIRMFQEEGDT
jgi:hypothetical protein